MVDVNVNVNYKPSVMTETKLSAVSKWSIREFAALFDITPRAIRFYEDKGLISPSREGGSRVFGAIDYLRFERILRAKRLGFTLDDIKEVLEVTDGDVSDRAELLRRQGNFRRVIKGLARRRQDIDVLTAEMSEICDLLDRHLAETDPQSHGLAFAADYDAVFRRYLIDGFEPDTAHAPETACAQDTGHANPPDS